MKLLRQLLVLFAINACASGAPPAAPQPYLWRIDGTKPSYVYGTIHLASPDVATLATATTKAVDSVDALYCELPLDPASQMKMAGALMSAEKPLSEVLPKDLYARVEAELKRINPALTLQPFERMEIWALSVTVAMLEDQFKHIGAQLVDVILFNRAAAAQKEVGGLETFAEQMQLFGQFSNEEQCAMLRATLDDMERLRRDGRSALDEIRGAYRSGELERIEKSTTEWMASIEPGLRKKFGTALFTDRNHLMAERIAAKLKQSPERAFFFAVGAGHLYGPEGVIALLEKAGYKLSRVNE